MRRWSMALPPDVVKQLLSLPDKEAFRTLVKKFVAPDFDRALDEASTILCVAPHPDDCEVGAGGTLAALASKGKKVFIAVATYGSLGTTDPRVSPADLASTRRREQKKAAEILGVKKVLWLGFRDGYLEYSRELRDKLVTIIRTLEPEVVMAPDPWMSYEAHPDHRYTGLAAAEATLFAGFPHYRAEDRESGLSPWAPRYIAFYYTSRPNYFYDITKFMDTKLRALKAHKSQFKEQLELIEMLIRFVSAIYGKRICVEYAEAFKLLPRMLIHAIPFAEVF